MTSGSKILLCDLNRTSQSIIQKTLSDHGHEVHITVDGHEALDAIKTLNYDLAILSGDAPSIDGFQVCRLVKEAEKTRHIPVIIMSGKTDHATRNHAIESGADEFLQAPVNRIELAARVLTLVRLKSLQDRLQFQIEEKEAEQAKLAQKSTELRVLSEIARIVLSVKDQHRVLQDILSLLTDSFDVSGSCLLVPAGPGWSVEAVSVSMGPVSFTKDFTPSMLLDDVWKNQKPITVLDCHSDPRTPSEFTEQFAPDIHSLVCSPVSVRAAAIGVMVIFYAGPPRPIMDLGLLMTLSGQVALAMENIRLFNRLSDFNKNLQEQIGESTKALVELKNFNESILQNISSGILTVSMEGEVTFVNKAGASILNVDGESLVGRPLREIVGEDSAAKLLTETPSIGPQSSELEMDLVTGHHTFLGYTTNKRLDSDGREAGHIVHFRDISQIREMRDTIYRMDRLVSLGMLTSGIAHEIRNPLAGIKTMAQALEKEMAVDDSRTEYVQRILKQINRLNELLKAFFTYARPVKPNRSDCDLRSIVSDILALLKQRIDSDSIRVEEYYDPRLPVLFIDGNQIEQVLMNLMINALDAMKPHGTLTLAAQNGHRSIPPYFFDSRDVIEISVSDTGGGIPKENLQTIFDPFFTTKPNGTGLGLSIVYRIIHEHHGQITVQSETGKGTTFHIYLPLFEKVGTSKTNVTADSR